MPDALPFDLGVKTEGRLPWRRQTQINQIAEVFAGESKTKTHRLLPDSPLHGMFTASNSA